MGRHWSQVVVKLDVENCATDGKCLNQLLDSQLVNAALLVAELFVQLVLEVTCEVEILDGWPLAGFVGVAVDFQFPLEIELWDSLKLFL
jgi:hypothetical protein